MMGGFDMFGFGMLMMVLFWLVVIGGAIWLVVWLVRGNQARGVPKDANTVLTDRQTALDILKTRYARGEISKEQYEDMRSHLSA